MSMTGLDRGEIGIVPKAPLRGQKCISVDRPPGFVRIGAISQSREALVRIDKEKGLLQGALQVPSSHCDERPDPEDISLLVIHNISLPPGEFGGDYIEQLFTGRLDWQAHPYFKTIEGLRVSSHLLIRRDGSVSQYVPFRRRAWHAGLSEFEGRSACNDFAIGIELEGTDDEPFTDAQYQALIGATRALQAAYPAITSDRIVGHSDIAPGRKTDPGPAFNWHYFLSQLGS